MRPKQAGEDENLIVFPTIKTEPFCRYVEYEKVIEKKDYYSLPEMLRAMDEAYKKGLSDVIKKIEKRYDKPIYKPFIRQVLLRIKELL